MSLRAAFAGLLQSNILKTTEVPESPSMATRSQQVWSQTWGSEHSGQVPKELCKTGKDIWQPKHAQPGCIWGTLPHTKSFRGRLAVRKEEKQQNQNTAELHNPCWVCPNPSGHLTIPKSEHLLSERGTPGLEWKAEKCDEPSAPPVIPPDPRAALSFPHLRVRPLAMPSSHFWFRQSSSLIHLFFEEISFHYFPGSWALWGITGGQWKIHVLSQ